MMDSPRKQDWLTAVLPVDFNLVHLPVDYIPVDYSLPRTLWLVVRTPGTFVMLEILVYVGHV